MTIPSRIIRGFNSKPGLPANVEIDGYVIESGVPVPPMNKHPHLIAILLAMHPEQSFLLDDMGARSKVFHLIKNHPELKDRKYTTRKTREGMRIWRLK